VIFPKIIFQKNVSFSRKKVENDFEMGVIPSKNFVLPKNSILVQKSDFDLRHILTQKSDPVTLSFRQ